MKISIRSVLSDTCATETHIEKVSGSFDGEVYRKSGRRREEYAAQIVTERSQYSRQHLQHQWDNGLVLVNGMVYYMSCAAVFVHTHACA